MIIDEPMDMDIKRPFKASVNGDYFSVKSVTLKPPLPHMAQQAYKMEQFFNQIGKEAATFSASLTTDEELQDARAEQANLPAPVVSLEDIPETYNADSESAREDKIKDIEEQIKVIKTMASMCSKVDIFAMTTEFSKMICQNNLCTVKGLDESQEIQETPMTTSMWKDKVDRRDRVAIMFRYCCFFDLTSSLND